MKNRMNKIAVALLCTGAFGSFGVHATELARGDVNFKGVVPAPTCQASVVDDVDFDILKKQGESQTAKDFIIKMNCDAGTVAAATDIKFSGSASAVNTNHFGNENVSVVISSVGVDNSVSELKNNKSEPIKLNDAILLNGGEQNLTFRALPVVHQGAKAGEFSIPVTFTIETQ